MLAIITTNLLGGPQVPHQESGKSGTPKGQSYTDPKPIPPVRVVIENPVPTIRTQEIADEHQGQAPEKPLPRFVRPEWVIVYITTIYVAFSILTWLAIKRQVNRMDQQRMDNNRSGADNLVALNRQIAALESQASVMDRQREDFNASSGEQTKAMNLQLAEMQAATAHSETQARALANQVKIMEAPYQQWIEIRNWNCMPFQATEENIIKRISVLFEVANPTNYLLVIPSGEITFSLDGDKTQCFTGDGVMFAPNTVQHKRLNITLTETQSLQFKTRGLLIDASGNLDFINVLGRIQPSPIKGRLWCTIAGAQFESGVVWQYQPQKEESSEGEQRAN